MTLSKLCTAQLLVGTVAGHAWSEWSKARQAKECIRDVTPVSAPEMIGDANDPGCNPTWWEQSLRVAAEAQDLKTVKQLTTDKRWLSCGKPKAGARDERHGFSALWYASTGPKNKVRGRIMKMIISRLFGDSDPEAVETVLGTLYQCDKYRHEVNNLLRQLIKSEDRMKRMAGPTWYCWGCTDMCRSDSFRHASLRWLEHHPAWPKFEQLLVYQTQYYIYKSEQKPLLQELVRVIDDTEKGLLGSDNFWIPVIGQLNLIKWVKKRVNTVSREVKIAKLHKLLQNGPLYSSLLKDMSYELRKEILLLYTFAVQRHNGSIEAFPAEFETIEESQGRYVNCPDLWDDEPRCLIWLTNPWLEYV